MWIKGVEGIINLDQVGLIDSFEDDGEYVITAGGSVIAGELTQEECSDLLKALSTILDVRDPVAFMKDEEPPF